MSNKGKNPQIPKPQGKSLIDPGMVDHYMQYRTRYEQADALSQGLAPRIGNYAVPTDGELAALDNDSTFATSGYNPQAMANFIEISNATRDRQLAEGKIDLALATTRLLIKMLNLVKTGKGYSKDYNEAELKRQELQSKQQQEILLNLIALKQRQNRQSKNGGKRKTKRKSRKNKTKRKGKRHRRRGGNKTSKLWSSGDRSPGESFTAPAPAPASAPAPAPASPPSYSFMLNMGGPKPPPTRRSSGKLASGRPKKLITPSGNQGTTANRTSLLNVPQEPAPEDRDFITRTPGYVEKLKKEGTFSRM
jgi:hypothetical protein